MTSAHLGHLVFKVFEDGYLWVWWVPPALEVPFILDALFPLDQPHHRRHIVDGDLLPLLYSLPRPQHHREVLGVYWGGKCLHKLDELEDVWRIIFYERRHWRRDILCQLCRLYWLDLCTNFLTWPGNKHKQTLLLTELIECPHNCAQIVCTLHSEFETLLTVSGEWFKPQTEIVSLCCQIAII